MCDLKKTLDAGGHCVLEMPSGTGKTVSLLSLIIAYQQHGPEHRKLIYCSRTMSEIEKALSELKALMEFRAQQLGYTEDFRALGLTSRKNLCLHPSVKREKSGTVVDARCRSLTAGFVKDKKEKGEDVDLCTYHEVRTCRYFISDLFTDLRLFLEPRSPRTAQPRSAWRIHLGRTSKIRRGAQAMPLLLGTAHGKLSQNLDVLSHLCF